MATMVRLKVLLTIGFLLGEGSAHNLTFLFITSFGQSGFNASGVVPAADIALEDINSHQNVLPGYTLMYDQVRDSQCHRSQSLDAFFDGIFMDTPRKLAVIGCGCSVATEPVAEISHQWNISQISYASSSTALSNRNKYKSFFRNTFNMKIIAPALRSAVAYFNWSRIAVLTQDEGLFTGTESDIRNEFERSCPSAAAAGSQSDPESCIRVENRVFDTDGDPTSVIDDLFTVDEDYRVFFVNSFSEHARRIICYAHRYNYTFPRYAWIMYDWYPSEWWVLKKLKPGDCSNEELTGFLDKVLTIQLPEFGNGSTEIGTTLDDFRNRYEESATNRSYNIINQAYKLYDVLWVLALALNDTDAIIKSGNISGTGCEALPGSLVPLEEFDYSNKMIACLIQWNIQKTDLLGVTGQVSFDADGTRIHTNVFFLQYKLQGHTLEKKRFAGVDENSNFTFTFLSGVDINDIYPDGAPLDGKPIKIVHTFQTWLTVVFYFLAILGIVFAIVCLLFNLIYRNRKTVRLSSPTLNYFIIGGAVLMYTSIFFYLLPTDVEIVVKARCVMQYWLFTLGYSLAFGAVFVKLWRVYQIFHNPQPNRKVLTDWKLIAIVLGIAGLTLFLLLFGEAVPYLRGVVVQLEDAELNNGRNSFGVREDYCVWVCQAVSSPSFYWQIFIFTYLTMLQVIALVLAIQTRKVKLRGLRDSKYIATIVYISSILIVVMALVTFALDKYINVGSGILATGIFLLTTTFLVLIFVPKMILLYKDPQGRKASTVIGPQSRSSAVNIQQEGSGELEQKVATLEKAMLEREKTITELQHEISLLKKENNTVQKENVKPDLTDSRSDSSGAESQGHEQEKKVDICE